LAVSTTPEMPFSDVAFTRRRVTPPRCPRPFPPPPSPFPSTCIGQVPRLVLLRSPSMSLLLPRGYGFITAFLSPSLSSDLRTWLSILLLFLSRIPPLTASSQFDTAVISSSVGGCLGNVTTEAAASPMQRKLEERVGAGSAPWSAPWRGGGEGICGGVFAGA
jgi:hypothetical protein